LRFNVSANFVCELLEVLFESKYCVLTEIYTASVIINVGVFCSLVLMRRRCSNDETEWVVVSLSSTRKHVICWCIAASYTDSSPFQLKSEFTQTQYLFIHKNAQELCHYVYECLPYIETPVYCTLSNYREKANLL